MLKEKQMIMIIIMVAKEDWRLQTKKQEKKLPKKAENHLIEN
jgi:hypothetical protein